MNPPSAYMHAVAIGALAAVAVAGMAQFRQEPASASAGSADAATMSSQGPSRPGAPEPIDPRADIEALQQQLVWTGAQGVTVNGAWDRATAAALKLFQAKARLPSTGRADDRTRALLQAAARGGSIDARCLSAAIVLCVDKRQKVVRYLRDGGVIMTADVNVGPEKGDPWYGKYSSTRAGVFGIFGKKPVAISNVYGTVMPYFMPFDRGIAFHASLPIVGTGYQTATYGCVTVNSKKAIEWIYRHTPIKTRVVVY